MANVKPPAAPGIGKGKMTDTTEQPQAVSDDIRLAEIELGRDKARWGYRRVIWVALIASLGVAIVTGLFQYGQAVREAALEDKKFSNSLQLEQSKFDFKSALELRQTSNAYLKDFLNEALGVNLERRVKFAEYFATMTEDEGLRARWAAYHDRVEGTLLEKLADEKAKEIEKTAEASKLVESRGVEADLLSKIATLEEESVERKNLEIDLAKVREEATKTAAMIATLQSGIEILKRDTSPQPTGGTSRSFSSLARAGGPKPPSNSGKPVKLRATRESELSDTKIIARVREYGFSLPGQNLYGNFQHNYELIDKDGSGNQVIVVDYATGLMWQQSGTPDTMTYVDALKYVDELNDMRFAGHKGWRLPTIEELISLVEPTQKSGSLYIDKIFNDRQRWVRSGDKKSYGNSWGIVFYEGSLYFPALNFPYYVRAVRSASS